MPIDFHDSANANTYASREAHAEWSARMRSVLHSRLPGVVADVGCGGGIYSRAWRALGAHAVIGIDSSEQMVEDARKSTNDEAIRFAVADAYDTGLIDASCEIVFSRAVVHHLSNHNAAMTEAFRTLKPGGMVVVQDRSLEDVLQPASARHFRAHFFSRFPRLLEIERRRRPGTGAFMETLASSGFENVSSTTLWETRRSYQSAEELREDLMARTGRSILHELSDDELASLTTTILTASEGHFPLEERDRWTIWSAMKPANS